MQYPWFACMEPMLTVPGLSQVMAGSIESKAAFYFSLYDMDGSGEIDREELLRVCNNWHSP